jgi:hypothetical protein
MKKHEEAIIRVAEMPGLGVDSAQQIAAEVGVAAETFASAGEFNQFVGRGLPRIECQCRAEPQLPLSERQSLCMEDLDSSRASGGAEEGLPLPVDLPPVLAETWF